MIKIKLSNLYDQYNYIYVSLMTQFLNLDKFEDLIFNFESLTTIIL